MKKLWLIITLILVLNRITVVGESTPRIEVVKPVEVEDCREYYQLWSGGQIVDSSRVTVVGYTVIIDRMVPVVSRLIEAARRDKVDLRVTNGYRTFKQQLMIRRKHIRDKVKKASLKFLLTAKSNEFYPVTGKPGHSKHQDGLAYDFNTRHKGVYAWLKKNAYKYGFVRTVSSEEWHWEYLPKTASPHWFVCEDDSTWNQDNNVKYNRSFSR